VALGASPEPQHLLSFSLPFITRQYTSTAKLSSTHAKAIRFRRHLREVRRRLSPQGSKQQPPLEAEDTDRLHFDGLAEPEAIEREPDMPFYKKRLGGDVCAIFVHAGAGYHSVQNENVHLQACAE